MHINPCSWYNILLHGTETRIPKRKQSDGKSIHVSAPSVIKDHNELMGGVDHQDQLRQCYGLVRSSNKWWKRIFWGYLEINSINSFTIAKKVLEDTPTNLLVFRRNLTRSLCYMSPHRINKRKPTSSSLKEKKRRRNHSVSSGIRLAILRSHLPTFVERQGSRELCCSRCIQSKPSSCSLCKVFCV